MSVFLPRIFVSQPARFGGCGTSYNNSSRCGGGASRRQIYNPLWDLFDSTFDEIARHQARTVQQQRCQQRRAAASAATATFSPRFDIKEGESAYTLEGELPGVAQEDVEIQFLDEATLQIKSQTRSEKTTAEAVTHDNNSNSSNNEKDDLVTLTDKNERPASVASENTLQATVEDDNEDEEAQDWVSIADGNEKSTPAHAPHHSSTVAEDRDSIREGKKPARLEGESEGKAAAQQPVAAAAAAPAAANHTWLSERRHGEFTRTFRFSERVDRDATTASYKNGLLRIVVPKGTAPEARKISIE